MPGHRDLQPLETPATPVLLTGTVLFGLALIVFAVAGGPRAWLAICGYGMALGLIGVPAARRMQRPRR